MNQRMLRRAVLAGGIAVLAAVSFGNPHRYIADVFWPGDAAPWEHVTAVYTPDVTRPTRMDISETSFDSLTACRTYLTEQAIKHGDPNLTKGKAVCAIGFYTDGDDNSTGAYRLIVTGA